MTTEFTSYCNLYYKLKQLHTKRVQRLARKLARVPLYNGQTDLSEIDDIISYYRDVQADKEKLDKTEKDIANTRRNILLIMKHFEIPPNTVLNGLIPGEVEYEIYADESDTLHITKTKDLAPLKDNPNIIIIKVWQEGNSEEDEDF